jgi:alkylated DNA repair dioxygenase AlkB
MASNQLSLFDVAGPPRLPEGFRYHEEAISHDAEQRLLAEFARFPFKEFQFHGFEGKRRVVYFGWQYDFSDQKVLQAEPIPPILVDVCKRMQASSGFVLKDLQQVLVAEYAPGAPIGWHRDRPEFGQVMGLSLLSACQFRLRKGAGKSWDRASLRLEPRSAYLIDGPARWEWEHSIPPVEALRYSITFRNIR